MNNHKKALRLLKDVLELFGVNDKNYQNTGYCFGDLIPDPDDFNKLLKQSYEIIIKEQTQETIVDTSKCEYCKNRYYCNKKLEFQQLEKEWRCNPKRDYFEINCKDYQYDDY